MSFLYSFILICFINIFDINGLLGKISNKNFKIDVGVLILVIG